MVVRPLRWPRGLDWLVAHNSSALDPAGHPDMGHEEEGHWPWESARVPSRLQSCPTPAAWAENTKTGFQNGNCQLPEQ